MAMLTVRNVPDTVHRALRARATQNGRSTEAEVRDILASAVAPASRVRLGDALAMLGQELGLTESDWTAIEQTRDTTPAQPVALL